MRRQRVNNQVSKIISYLSIDKLSSVKTVTWYNVGSTSLGMKGGNMLAKANTELSLPEG